MRGVVTGKLAHWDRVLTRHQRDMILIGLGVRDVAGGECRREPFDA